MTPVNTGRRGRRLMGEINVVPYIDVMLVLLIIFMVTAPLLTQGIKVDLPKAGAEPLPEDLTKDHQPMVLSIDKQGRFFLNLSQKQDMPLSEQLVGDLVADVLKREPKTPVLVKADRNVPYGKVVSGMVILQHAGAEQIGFITDPLEKVPIRKN